MPPSLSDLKAYLGITGSSEDTRLTVALASGIAQMESDTGRRFAAASNTSIPYSTNGEVLVSILDVPRSDPSRVVTWNGVALVENSTYWLLPDRRNPDISTQLQIGLFTDRPDAYKADPNWWDKNLDRFWNRRSGLPNDLTVQGIVGHPFWRNDVTEQALFLGAWFFWRAKSGASGVVQLPSGEEVDLGSQPIASPDFVRNWRVRTAVAGV